MNTDSKRELAISGIIIIGVAISLLLIPAFAGDTLFLVQSASAGNVTLALDDLTDVTIISVSNGQIIVYNSTSGLWENENQASFSDTTTCGNIGGGIILCAGGNVQLKSLIAGTAISISNTSSTVTITNTSPESTVCTNLNPTGEGIYVSGNCNFKKLLAGSGITLSSNGTRITITNSLPESTVCSNTGTGNGLCNGGNVNIKSLIAGTCITIADTIDDYTFSSSCGANHNLLDGSVHPDTVAQTVSRGSLIYGDITPKWNELTIGGASKYLRSNSTDASWSYNKRTLISSNSTLSLDDELVEVLASSAGINIGLPTAVGNTGKVYTIKKVDVNTITSVEIDPSGSQTIDGETTWLLSRQYDTITIHSDGANWKIDSNHELIAQLVSDIYQSVTKTNIGTTYVDVYATAFDREDLNFISVTGAHQFFIFWLWDYVGAGTQQLRWVSASDNNCVLFQSSTFTADQDAGSSGDWIDLPACIRIGQDRVIIEEQGKSTTAADDPIGRGYVIYFK